MKLFVQTDDFRRLNVGFALDEGRFVSLLLLKNMHYKLLQLLRCNMYLLHVQILCSFQVFFCCSIVEMHADI